MFERFDEDFNNNSSIMPYDEEDVQPIGPQGILTGLSQIIIPQAGKKGSSFDRSKKIADTKRDPITDEQWKSVPESVRTVAKNYLEDTITVTSKFNKEVQENFEFYVLAVIPMTTYTQWIKRPDNRQPGKMFSVRQGGKGMWLTQNDGEQVMGSEARVVCMSQDGVAPLAQYVGVNPFTNTLNAPFHVGLQRNIPIGQDADGNVIPAEHICERCPFQDWSLPYNKRPQCGNQFKELFFLPTQVDIHGNVMSARLAWMGGSVTVQKALEGQKAGNKYGHKMLDLPSFERLIQPTKTNKLLVEANTFDMSKSQAISGFAKGTNKFDHLRGIDFHALPKGTVLRGEEDVVAYAQQLHNSGTLDEVTHIEYEEPEFAFAPQGFAGDIFAFAMFVGKSADDKWPQRIPVLRTRTEDGSKFLFDALTPFEKEQFPSFVQEAAERRALWKSQRASNVAAIEEKRNKQTETHVSVPEIPAEVPTDD